MEEEAASTLDDRLGERLVDDVDAPSMRLPSGLNELDGSNGLDGLIRVSWSGACTVSLSPTLSLQGSLHCSSTIHLRLDS